MKKNERLLDRDLSEISFYERVLDQVHRDITLSEQIFFIGVVFSNMQEYVMSRYPRKLKEDETRKRIVKKIKKRLENLYEKATEEFLEINKSRKLISRKNTNDVQVYFKDNIANTLQPVIFDEHVKIKSNSINILVELSDNDDFYIINMPENLERFIKIGEDFYLLDEVIKNNLKYIFKNKKIKKVSSFCLQRSFNMSFENEDIEENVKGFLKKIDKAWITRVELSSKNKKIIEALKNNLNVKKSDTIYVKSKILKLSDIKNIPKEVYKKNELPKKSKQLKPFNKSDSVLEYIGKRDLLVFHPYESFDNSVIGFIKEAASDKKTISIKMTIYRLAKDSKIVKALIRAAKNGIKVTVLVELKARFSEEDNLYQSLMMREYGINIIYSNNDIKTHAKMCLITQKTNKGIISYAQIGTGNYSEVNSKGYTDYSYFTKNRDMCKELNNFYNMVVGASDKFDSKKLLYAPDTIEKSIIELIDEQIKLKKEGYICFKCNAITDPEIANKIYEASSAGVKIILIVRSACILRPGVKDLSENIKIYSVIGKYLEHSRVYIFGKNKNSKMYIGSSDLMTRNLKRRNELLILVSKKIEKTIKKHIDFYLNDDVNKYIINDNYKFTRKDDKRKNRKTDCHTRIIKSLK